MEAMRATAREGHRGQLGYSERALWSSRSDGLPTMTRREREIVALVAEGYENGAIASLLRISAETVKAHLRNMREKTGAANRAALVAYAYETGLLIPLRAASLCDAVASSALPARKEAHPSLPGSPFRAGSADRRPSRRDARVAAA